MKNYELILTNQTTENYNQQKVNLKEFNYFITIYLSSHINRRTQIHKINWKIMVAKLKQKKKKSKLQTNTKLEGSNHSLHIYSFFPF
jgi:hypothetical protein